MMGRWYVLRLFAVIMAMALPLMGRGTAAQEDTFLKVAQDPAVGSFLTDAEGNTLYLFTPDSTPGESACYDDCEGVATPRSSGRNDPAGWCARRAGHYRAHGWNTAGHLQRHPALLLREG